MIYTKKVVCALASFLLHLKKKGVLNKPVVVKRTRATKGKHINLNKLSNCGWLIMLKNNIELSDPSSLAAKVFRSRFRLPYPLFLKLVNMCKERNLFPYGDHNCAGQPSIPLEIKILGVLRVLGRGVSFDDVAELSGGAYKGEVHRSFFHQFCEQFVEAFGNEYICPPKTSDEIDRVLHMYEKLGLPGCVGSVDCTHVPWDRCPAALHSLYTGKEGYPTIAYEVVCDHTHKIMSVSSGHYGSRNDKTIVRFDGFVSAVRKSPLYTQYNYNLVNATGVSYANRGLYLICDNGYHRWRVLQPPLKDSSVAAEIRYSKWLESVRKDIECTFGILKKRFKLLNNPMLIKSQAHIDNVFRVCCILHNMLLSYDGYDTRWDCEAEDAHFQQESNSESAVVTYYNSRVERALSEMHSGICHFNVNTVPVHDIYCGVADVEEFEPGFFELRNKLIVHFNVQKNANKVVWLQ